MDQDLLNLIKLCLKEYQFDLSKYQKMQDYYNGDTDAMKNYKMISSRANNKTSVNFIKKFIKEETSYVLGNKLTLISRSGEEGIVNVIQQNIAHWSEKHDQNLLKNSLKFGINYELYFIDRLGQFSSRIITPLNGYALINDEDNVQMFLHIFKRKFEKKRYLDVYLSDRIVHFELGENSYSLKELGETPHFFGEVPVSVCPIAEEQDLDTLFRDLKLLQDAYETNLSDISSEISDFRQAYLILTGCDINDSDLPKMKELGAIKVPDKDATIQWLIKNINDTFIQNTLSTLEDKMYQISAHINSNEKLQSNTSSLALRTRLISLENKCKLNQDAISDCIKNRLRILFKFVALKTGAQYDYRDIKFKFTPMIPSDDLMMAQILAQAGDRLSLETGIAQFSFVDNPKEEIKKLQEEKANSMIDLSGIQ